MASDPPVKPTPSFGALSAQVKDHVYLLDGGTIFTSPWVVTEAIVRRTATIMLTALGAAFDLRTGDATKSYQAAAIKPLTERGVRAENVRLVSVLVNPMHRHFRAFRAIPAPGALALARTAYTQFDSALDSAYHGKLTANDASMLLEGVVATTLQFLPETKLVDARIEQAVELLRNNSDYHLEELAAAIGLSYGGMSRLFAESMGISLRSYQLWGEIHAALWSLTFSKNLTDIAHRTGFTDLSHLSRLFQQAAGAPMSYFRDKDHVQVFFYGKTGRPDPAAEIAQRIPS